MDGMDMDGLTVEKMEEMRLEDSCSPPPDPPTSSEVKKLRIEKCVDHLVHASDCRDLSCRMVECRKVKRVIAHYIMCKKKFKGTCRISKQLIALCCYHVKRCKDDRCPVHFCSWIKHGTSPSQQQVQLLEKKMSLMCLKKNRC